MPTITDSKNTAPKKPEQDTPETVRASHPIRILRAVTLAMILTVLGAWLGFC